MKELITRVEELAVANERAMRHLEKQDREITEQNEVIGKARLLNKSLNDEITKRDRELREMDAEAKAHREVIQKKDAEIQEWLMQLATARNERDAALREAESLRSQVPLESTREALKNAVAKLQEVTTERDRLVIKFANLGSYAMTIGRKEGEPLEMFMERQALRLAALETTIAAAKCDELAKATARIKPLEALYDTLKGWQENDHIIGYGLTIDTAINKATEALSQLTA